MDKDQWIAKALAQRLTEREQKVFEKMLQDDPELASEYRFERDLKMAIEHDARIQLKSDLVSHEKKSRSTIWYWVAAAVLLICLLAGGIIFKMQNTPQDLYAANYEKFPNIIAPLTRGHLSEREAAYKAYDEGQYEQAYELFSALKEDSAATFYQGICLIELGEFQRAMTHFETISFKGSFEEHRLWYLSLLYLKDQKEDKAKDLLNKLAAGSSVWNVKAQNLLDHL